MNAEVTTLAAMLESNEEYVIPHFQRAYAWTQESQWSPLWDDITNVAEAIAASDSIDDVPPHFMGPIVIQERSAHPDGRPPGFIVVDGQQRMTTLLIALKAIGEAAMERGLDDLSEQFLNRIWNDVGLDQRTPKVRHTNRSDSLSLREVLDEQLSTDAVSRMADCHAFFNKSALDYLGVPDGREQRCQNLLDALEFKLETALLTLDPSEQPNVVFETLNARAEPLKPSELVKNTIMYEGRVTEDEERASALWNRQFEDSWWGETTGQDSKLDLFLSDWLTSRLCRRIAPSRVATEFRNYLQVVKASGRNVQYVTDRMNRSAKIYRDIEEHDFSETRPSSERLLNMGVRAILPVTLWLWDADNAVEVRERQTCLRTIESYIVRRILANLNVGATLMNTMVSLLPQLRRASEEGTSRHVAVVSTLKNITIDASRWPNDTEIMQRLTTSRHEMSAGRRDVVLNALESRLRRENGHSQLGYKAQSAYLMPSGEAGMANYPLEGNRTQARMERRKERIEYLGNLTLTRGRLNRRNQDAPWNDKLEILNNHREIELTKAVLEQGCEQWTDQDIEDRTVWMTELALRTWPYPDN